MKIFIEQNDEVKLRIEVTLENQQRKGNKIELKSKENL